MSKNKSSRRQENNRKEWTQEIEQKRNKNEREK